MQALKSVADFYLQGVRGIRKAVNRQRLPCPVGEAAG